MAIHFRKPKDIPNSDKAYGLCWFINQCDRCPLDSACDDDAVGSFTEKEYSVLKDYVEGLGFDVDRMAIAYDCLMDVSFQDKYYGKELYLWDVDHLNDIKNIETNES